MTRIFYSTWVKPACCVSKISSDGGCQSKETGVGMEVRLLPVGARGFFLAASPLNVLSPPTRKKTSGTQGSPYLQQCQHYLQHRGPTEAANLVVCSKCKEMYGRIFKSLI